MIKLVALLALVVAGYFVWMAMNPIHPRAGEAAPVPADAESIQTADSPAEEKAPFFVRSRVRSLIEDLKKLESGQIRGQTVTQTKSLMASKVSDIRQYFLREKKFDEATVREAMLRAAIELGHDEEQARIVVGKILGISSKP